MSLSYESKTTSVVSPAMSLVLASCHRNNTNYYYSHPCLLLITMLVLVANVQLVSAKGLGTNRVLIEGSTLVEDYGKEQDDSSQDVLFKQANLDGAHEAKYIKYIRQLQVDVVPVGRELRMMMNEVSTRIVAMFLREYEHYYEELEMRSISKPMLKVFLGLMMTTEAQMKSWYRPKRRRLGDKINDQCKALFAIREQATSLERDPKELVAFVQDLKAVNDEALKQRTRFRLAYLVFQNNLNLFMLETNLLLCAKLEPQRLATELSGEFEFLF